MNLRTASLVTALLAAAVSSLPAPANAQWRGGWGWGGFGVGLATGAIIGGALAAPSEFPTSTACSANASGTLTHNDGRIERLPEAGGRTRLEN